MILQPLTSSEEEITQHIWKKESIYFRELMNAFAEPKPHQNTVSTFLKILVDKNYLKTEKQGRIYLYTAAVKQEDYIKSVTKTFLQQYYNNSAKDLVNFLVGEKLLKETDITSKNEVPTKPKKAVKDPIKDLVEEITSDKKSKKKDKEKDKDKKKKKKK